MNSLEILTRGEIKVEGRLVEASNATLFTRITFGDFHMQAIYKPIAGERPLWDFPDGNLASREVAAFRISELGRWNLIPYTILRDGPFGPGAVQEWIDIDEEFDLATYFSTDDPQLRSLALLDAVINNTDRKIGHLLMTKTGRLYACDHGVTFHADDKLRTVLWQFAGESLSDTELTQLTELKDALTANETELSQYLSHSEIQALKGRIENLRSNGDFPRPREDWPSIPWPPF